ncbi:MAG: hypothetical protein IKV87_05930 [Methanobrevibacter sp.]|nr:hypothetical protein [Methanobrevibacter sp.]
MDEEVIDIEDFEVKEKSIVVSDEEEEDEEKYSRSSNNDYSPHASYKSVTLNLSEGKLLILALVAVLLVAIFVLTFC